MQANDNAIDTATDALLDMVQRDSFQFFLKHVNPANGLVCDSNEPNSPASIAGVGFALTAYPIAVCHGWMSRADALAHSLAAARFFHGAEQSEAVDATGYRGFFYHFLDMTHGRRTWRCELSTIDTTLLVAGLLFAARFFDGDTAEERELRSTVAAIYERIDWAWAQNDGRTISMGWRPASGFLRSRWIGYDEALLLYVLALGSPSHPIDAESYVHWLAGYRWKTIYGQSYVYAGPLFIHQFSHIWIDFRRIRDAYMAHYESDYFENSRRATHVHREYAIRNPHRYRDYHGQCWGLTASDGPGPAVRTIDQRTRRFFDYRARGAPFGPDDGTVAPWASIASLPFAPELVLPTIRHLVEETYDHASGFGFNCSFNPSFHVNPGDAGWVSPWHVGINQGPIVLMIQNYRDELIWRLMRGCAPIVTGLQRAGFSGGWLDGL